MGICFADSLKQYLDENVTPDNGSSGDNNQADQGNNNVDIYEGLGTVDKNTTWIPVKDQGYEFFDDYECDDVSAVNRSKRIILKPNQMNFAQESNSQYIPFQMPRYFDGYDMGKTKIQFYYINRDGQYGIDYAINVYTSEDKIRFAWLISPSVTQLSGTVKFEIQAIGVNSNGRPYMWKTYPNDEISIEESLSASVYIEPDENWQQNFYEDLNNRMEHVLDLFDNAETRANEAQLAAENAITSVNNSREEAESAIVRIKRDAVGEIETVKSDALSIAEDAKREMEGLRSNLDTVVEEIYEERSTETINNKVAAAMTNYHTKAEIDEIVADVSDQIDMVKNDVLNLDGLAKFNVSYDGSTMSFYNGDDLMREIAINSDPTEEWTEGYTAVIDEKIAETKTEIQEVIDEHTNLANEAFATKSSLASLVESVGEHDASIDTNRTNISTLSDKIVELEGIVNDVDTSPKFTYDMTYDDEFKLSLWEQEGDDESTRTVKSQVVIQGGAGGSGGTSSVLKIEYITKTPLVATTNDRVVIRYNFSGEDSSGDQVMEGTETWKVGNSIVASRLIGAGENVFDITDYVTIGTQKVTLSIVDDAGSLVTKRWTVQVIDVRIESTFNDSFTQPMGTVSFGYTPYGAVSKVVHFVLDGNEIGSVTTSVSGVPMAFTLPAQEHGSHLLDVYMTADMNGDGIDDIESNHIAKDILWYDPNSSVPVIGCIYQNFTAMQYDTTNIVYSVHDPSTETPTVTLAEDGKVVSVKTLESSSDIWPYKSTSVGTHVLTITCGDTVKTLNVTIEELNIPIEPVVGGLVFDFNPVGKSNSDANRLWSDGDISMSVSDNFDWINGGYQIDANGDQYFCIKAGTSALINYQLFADDAKKNGKEFKLVFRSTNIQTADAMFLSCVDNTTGDNHIGIEMGVHEATIYGKEGSLVLPYSEEDIIEFEFNISKNTEDVPMVMGYEDGVSTRPMVYDDSFDFTQNTKKYISLGSDKCDLHIYRFKVYNTSLNARGVLNNFIADARNATEMIDRYNRNNIYDENQNLDPDILAEACPWLRVYKLSAPYFTNNKSDKVPGTTIQQIYVNGDRVLDNWTCYNAMHSGQGTSSNNYGASGRNLDFIMDKSGIDGVEPRIVLGDGSEAKTITMTRSSVPVAYLNAKVNIASSNNMTNAMLAKRYDKFNPYNRPYIRTAKLSDVYTESQIAAMSEVERSEALAVLQAKINAEKSYIKDTMEFHNCVIFIQETDPDISTHREFADTSWHFYAIGNIGDSKKTDNTRLTDIDDRYECCVEIMDVELPLSNWPADTMYNAMGYKVDKVTEEKKYIWAKDENLGILYEKINGEYVITSDTKVDLTKTYYVDILEHDDFSEDFTYGWRYIYKGGTDEENAEVFDYCKQKWIEMYRFVTTSTDEEFRAHIGDYFVLNSALYYYLFTTRYCMVDNRAKNSFWHYGKTGDVDTDGNPIRKWDLCWDYDNDTAIGLNNYGKQVYRHGLEDIDVDDNGEEVFRESDSTFFCRIRDMFPGELRAMYNTLESQNAWHAESFINQADAWQAEFPEELWRIDIDRKYIRTYNSSFIKGEGDTQFLTNMCNGRMKYHRRQWERAQEKYMASKYQSSVASSDNAVFRCTVPTGELVVKPNYRLKLTPYDYMYLNVKYGTQSPIQMRAKPGIEYEIPFDGTSTDIIDVYSSSNIQSFGDLSSCYPATVDTSKASKIKELIIGNSTAGYDNPGLTSLTLGANALLEVLNVENISGLTQTLDMSSLHSLRELYAHGTNASGVTFAPGGMIEVAELPAIGSITMRNLLYLADLNIISLNKLTKLVVEHCDTVDLLNIISSAPNLNRIRLIGVNWNLPNTSLLDRLYAMGGVDKDGYNATQSVLTGNVHVPVIREQQKREFEKAWPDLKIYPESIIKQFAVTFKNDNGEVLEIQYVDMGENAVDPTKRADSPLVVTKDSTVSHYFVFAGWDSSLDRVLTDRIVTATFDSFLRTYTVKYVAKGDVYQQSEGLYGDIIPYTGAIPVYTDEEDAFVYHLFNRWDQSGIVNGNKTIEAVFDRFAYVDGAFNDRLISDLSPVEIYAMIKLGMTQSVVRDKDYFELPFGNDFDYNDIHSVEIISSPTSFDGSNYVNSGIKLFDEDRDFVLAIDYEFLDGNTTKSVLAQCYQDSGFNGFKLWYSDDVLYKGSKFTWGSNDEIMVAKDKREMLVIRHKKGQNNLDIYKSNIDGDGVVGITISRTKSTIIDSELVFGAMLKPDGSYENFGVGNINWCKLWYGDIGDAACRELAVWPHEKIGMEACGYKKYYLTNNSSQRCAISFLATTLLDKLYPWSSNGQNSNSGGWGMSYLNRILNTRVYNAIPTQIRSLIKEVNIPSSLGGKSTEVDTFPCYITSPSVIELDPTMTSNPYINEGDHISYMTIDQTRIRTFADGRSSSYWTRSPNAAYVDYVWKVNANGSLAGFNIPYYEAAVLIEISM